MNTYYLTNLTNGTSRDRFQITHLELRMAKPINIYEAKTHLSELVDRAAAGEEIVIAKAGTPVARLVPLAVAGSGRMPGRWAGKVKIADDFDAALPAELLDAFEGGGE